LPPKAVTSAGARRIGAGWPDHPGKRDCRVRRIITMLISSSPRLNRFLAFVFLDGNNLERCAHYSIGDGIRRSALRPGVFLVDAAALRGRAGTHVHMNETQPPVLDGDQSDNSARSSAVYLY
jgi:hypothetical protein